MEQDQDPGLTNFLPPHMPSDQKDLPPGEGVLQGKSCWHLLGPPDTPLTLNTSIMRPTASHLPLEPPWSLWTLKYVHGRGTDH